MTTSSPSMNVLLVEPNYPNKFPPLGLMKIATYHKDRGDRVTFFKGMLKGGSGFFFDRVYVSTLFSFHHERATSTILHYKKLLGGNLRKLYVGGIYASLNPNVIFNETGVYPVTGLLDKPGILGNDKVIVDSLIPDYEILDQIDYDYGLKDAYLGYASRGCPRRCPFCAVPKLEPVFLDYIDIKRYIAAIRDRFGEKLHLVLMDNNVLASKSLERIISDIQSLGFGRGAKLNRLKRTVDFNQGIDAQRITPHTATLLASICAEPIRLAYDHVNERKIFERAVRILNDVGIRSLSSYVLYNYNDKPADLYARLRHAAELNTALGTTIYSFPMRYTPLEARDRRHVGPHWSLKHVRGLQCILNVTSGVVSHRLDFFLKAFGNSPAEFEEITLMPDEYILQRLKHENNGASEWRRDYRKLTVQQKDEFTAVVAPNDQSIMREALLHSHSTRIRHLLEHYLEAGI